jgi:hypothetical protein
MRTEIILSLLAGSSFVFLDFFLDYVFSSGNYLVWIVVRNIVWPAFFIWGYLKFRNYLIAPVSFIGLIIGIIIAASISIGELKLASIPAAILGYMLYSASFLPLLLLTIFFFVLSIKEIQD